MHSYLPTSYYYCALYECLLCAHIKLLIIIILLINVAAVSCDVRVVTQYVIITSLVAIYKSLTSYKNQPVHAYVQWPWHTSSHYIILNHWDDAWLSWLLYMYWLVGELAHDILKLWLSCPCDEQWLCRGAVATQWLYTHIATTFLCLANSTWSW